MLIIVGNKYHLLNMQKSFTTKPMEPKEKAKELVDKFTLVGLQQRNEGIQCALILVDERLKELDFTHIGYGKGIIEGYQRTKVKYWKEVKNEIEKL